MATPFATITVSPALITGPAGPAGPIDRTYTDAQVAAAVTTAAGDATSKASAAIAAAATDATNKANAVDLAQPRSLSAAQKATSQRNIGQSIGTRLRRAASRAADSNVLTNPPWISTPAWAPSTAYTVGQVVANGGNEYICYIAGTSAASGGPSGAGTAVITDGTAKWYYNGVPALTTSSTSAPTITYSASAPSGLTQWVDPISKPNCFYFAGGTYQAAPTNSTTQACFPTTTVGTSGGNVGLGTGKQNVSFRWSCIVDDVKFAVGTNNSSNPLRVIIDGRYVLPGADVYGAGNPCWRVFDFTTSGGRKRRHVIVESYGSSYCAGIRVSPTGTVSAPAITDPIRAAFLGSSIEAGANAFPIVSGGGYIEQFGRLVGISDVRNMGIGGTGFTIAGSAYTYQGHITDVTSISPDIVFVGGPINDNGVASATLQAAVVSLHNALRAALPLAPIVYMGCYPASSGPDAGHINAENYVFSAVAGLDSNAYTLPFLSDPTGYILSGTGTEAVPTGTGSADAYQTSDGTHPNHTGINNVARWVDARYRASVLPLIP